MMPTIGMGWPMYGIWLKAALVSSPPSRVATLMASLPIMLLTSTSPVIRQTTTVSQKVPVADTRAWRTGLRVWAAAATMGAEPMPDSLENRPRAIP